LMGASQSGWIVALAASRSQDVAFIRGAWPSHLLFHLSCLIIMKSNINGKNGKAEWFLPFRTYGLIVNGDPGGVNIPGA
jgi:hypothetical protein